MGAGDGADAACGGALRRAAETRLGLLPDVDAARAARLAERTKERRRGRLQRQRLAEDWKHKREGTPETHERASQTRQGALARLHQSGAISDDQLAWAHEIAQVAERLMRDADIRTASLETRIDVSRHGDAFYESLGAVRREVAYTAWRTRLNRAAAPVLDMVVGDIGVEAAARRHGMGRARMKRLLTDALDLWPGTLGQAGKEVTPADLAAAQAGLL